MELERRLEDEQILRAIELSKHDGNIVVQQNVINYIIII